MLISFRELRLISKHQKFRRKVLRGDLLITPSKLPCNRFRWWVSLHLRIEWAMFREVKVRISNIIMLWILSLYSLRNRCFKVQLSRWNRLFLDTQQAEATKSTIKFPSKHRKELLQYHLKTWKCIKLCKQFNKCCKVFNSNKTNMLLQRLETTCNSW